MLDSYHVPRNGLLSSWEKLERLEVARLEVKLGAVPELPEPEILEDAAKLRGERRMLRTVMRDEALVASRVDEGETVEELVILRFLHRIGLHRRGSVAAHLDDAAARGAPACASIVKAPTFRLRQGEAARLERLLRLL
jgi:hypothetical protein